MKADINHNIAKNIVKKDSYMKFYDTARSLYLETDASDVCIGAGLWHVRDSMGCVNDRVPGNATLHPNAFISKSLLNTGWHYRNIEWKALGILHYLEKFHYYCSAREECTITDHKPLVAMFNKYVATLTHFLQHIILCIHQFRVHIIY